MFLKKHVKPAPQTDRTSRSIPNPQPVSQRTTRRVVVSAPPPSHSRVVATKTADLACPPKQQPCRQEASGKPNATAEAASVVDLTASKAKGQSVKTSIYQSKQKLELMTRKGLEELYAQHEKECVSSFRKADYIRELNKLENERYIEELCKQSEDRLSDEGVKGLRYQTREVQNYVLIRIAQQQMLDEKVKSLKRNMTSLQNKNNAQKKRITKVKNLLETLKSKVKKMQQNYISEKNKVSTFEKSLKEMQDAFKEKQNRLKVQVVTLIKERDMWKESKATEMLKLLTESAPDADQNGRLQKLEEEVLKYKNLLNESITQMNEQTSRLQHLKKRRADPATPPQTPSRLISQSTPVKKRRVETA